VYAGGPVAYQNELMRTTGAMVHSFFPDTVTIHQGDTVVWNGAALLAGVHTIDLLGPNKSDLPAAVPNPADPVSGAVDPAGAPFWFNGQPSVGFNPALAAPTPNPTDGPYRYDGSTRLDSGLQHGPPRSFAVTFTKPGTYHFVCDVHNGMEGTVIVLPRSRTVPSVAADAATIRREELRDEAIARRLDQTKVARPNLSRGEITGPSVSLGEAGADGVEVMEMFPATLHIKVGTIVTFSVSKLSRDVHTATFGDTSPKGLVTQLGQKALKGATIDPRAVYPSDPPGGGPLLLGPTTHGGFANTGFLDRDPGTPSPPSARIEFTQPGVYHYICVIHPMMHGTIIVGS